jgi:hypothetical protein
VEKSNLLILKIYSINGYVDRSIQCPAQFLQDSARNITIKENPKFQVWNIRDQTNTLHSHQLHRHTFVVINGGRSIFSMRSRTNKR